MVIRDLCRIHEGPHRIALGSPRSREKKEEENRKDEHYGRWLTALEEKQKGNTRGFTGGKVVVIKWGGAVWEGATKKDNKGDDV